MPKTGKFTRARQKFTRALLAIHMTFRMPDGRAQKTVCKQAKGFGTLRQGSDLPGAKRKHLFDSSI